MQLRCRKAGNHEEALQGLCLSASIPKGGSRHSTGWCPVFTQLLRGRMIARPQRADRVISVRWRIDWADTAAPLEIRTFVEPLCGSHHHSGREPRVRWATLGLIEPLHGSRTSLASMEFPMVGTSGFADSRGKLPHSKVFFGFFPFSAYSWPFCCEHSNVRTHDCKPLILSMPVRKATPTVLSAWKAGSPCGGSSRN